MGKDFYTIHYTITQGNEIQHRISDSITAHNASEAIRLLLESYKACDCAFIVTRVVKSHLYKGTLMDSELKCYKVDGVDFSRGRVKTSQYTGKKYIDYYHLPTLSIWAEDSDDALHEARDTDVNYDTTQMMAVTEYPIYSN